MDTALQSQLDRIERALSTLTRSISNFAPNHDSAKELVAANNALNTGIRDLAQHQRNHKRIEDLRSTSTNLDLQLTERLRSLVDLRRSINAATLHAPLDESSSILAAKVVNYGLAIAKFQAPSTYKPPSAWQVEQQEAMVVSEAQTQQTTAQASPVDTPTPANGPGTAAVSTEASTPAVQQNLKVEGEAEGQDAEENQAIRALSDNERATINPVTGQPFWPWVNEAMMDHSYLKQYQGRPIDVIARLEQEWNEGKKEQGQETMAAQAPDQAQAPRQEQEVPPQASTDRPPAAASAAQPAEPAVFSWDDD